MPSFINEIGNKYGKLTVIEFAGIESHGQATWLCECECGNTTITRGNRLRKGATRSCGCLHKRPDTKTTMYKTPEYRIWISMNDRCYNEKSVVFHNYGGRGITVCTRWRESMQAFYDDMGPRPDGYTLDRINNDGPYSLENCRWATMKEQQNNRRDNHMLTYDGKTMTISQWADFLGVTQNLLNRRLHMGWSDERTLSQPLRYSKLSYLAPQTR